MGIGGPPTRLLEVVSERAGEGFDAFAPLARARSPLSLPRTAPRPSNLGGPVALIWYGHTASSSSRGVGGAGARDSSAPLTRINGRRLPATTTDA